MRDKNISWKRILDEVETLDAEGVKIDFLKPRGEFTAEDSSKPYPILGKLTFKNVSLLFGEGITEEKVQAKFIETNKYRIGSSVLYVPKFFDRQGDISDFVTAVSPKIIVTNSNLKNPNKPHYPRGIIDYAKKTPDVFRTDTQGEITVLTDGKQIRVITFLGKSKELVY